jgi:DNA modification methylase
MTTILTGNCLDILPTLPADSVQCCVTSPPYFGLRAYNGGEAEIGQEPTPEAFVAKLVEVFCQVRRVLRDDGTLWLNLGDSYFSDSKGSGGSNEKQDRNAGSQYATRKFKRTNGLKPKDLIGIPWRVAFALQADGWYLRQDIIWHKPNPMPEPVRDRCTKAHEYIFLLTKSARYFYDAEALKEQSEHIYTAGHVTQNSYQEGSGRNDGGQHRAGIGFGTGANGTRNRRSVWTIATQPFSGAHFATFPPDLIKPCIMAGTRPGDTVLDPFGGSGTTGMVATELGRKSIIIELNPEYAAIANKRTNVTFGLPL